MLRFLALLLLCVPAFAYPVRVKPTVTKKGSYRQGHVRTSPDNTQRNNWSAKGNVNPYTGKPGHKRVKK